MRTSHAVSVGGVAYLMDAPSFNRLQRIAMEQSRLQIPLLLAIDVFARLSHHFPVPIGMAAMWDPDLYEKAQSIAATEARAAGVTVTYSPMLDISRDPRWGRMVEGAGEGSLSRLEIAAPRCEAYKERAIGKGVFVCIKHFPPSYGAAIGGRDYAGRLSFRKPIFGTFIFRPFEAAVKAGAGCSD